jgi:hypothetical protein
VLGFLFGVGILVLILYFGGVFEGFTTQSELEDDDKDKKL